jgi:hypothetical protein
MTQTQYDRIDKALHTLSTDEADMIIIALVNLKLTSVSKESGLWQTAKQQATEFLQMRQDAQ